MAGACHPDSPAGAGGCGHGSTSRAERPAGRPVAWRKLQRCHAVFDRDLLPRAEERDNLHVGHIGAQVFQLNDSAVKRVWKRLLGDFELIALSPDIGEPEVKCPYIWIGKVGCKLRYLAADRKVRDNTAVPVVTL